MDYQTCSSAEEPSAVLAKTTSDADDLTGSEKPCRKYRPILVAIDFSPASRRALDIAVTLAERQEAQLVLVHVVKSCVYATHLGRTPADLASVAPPVKQRLETWAAEAIPARLLSRTALFGRSVLSHEIRDAAQKLRADLVSCQPDETLHVNAFPPSRRSD